MRVSELLLSESPWVLHTVETMRYLQRFLFHFAQPESLFIHEFQRTRWEAGADENWRPLILQICRNDGLMGIFAIRPFLFAALEGMKTSRARGGEHLSRRVVSNGSFHTVDVTAASMMARGSRVHK